MIIDMRMLPASRGEVDNSNQLESTRVGSSCNSFTSSSSVISMIRPMR